MISLDTKFKQIFPRKDVDVSRKKQYINVLSEVYTITNKIHSQLVSEAKEEEQPYLHNGVPCIKDISDRKITFYLYNYYEYLLKKNIIDATINYKLSCLRAFSYCIFF
jgi:hypothetical protein